MVQEFNTQFFSAAPEKNIINNKWIMVIIRDLGPHHQGRVLLYSCFCFTHWAVKQLSPTVHDQPRLLLSLSFSNNCLWLTNTPPAWHCGLSHTLISCSAPKAAASVSRCVSLWSREVWLQMSSFLDADRNGSERGWDLDEGAWQYRVSGRKEGKMLAKNVN